MTASPVELLKQQKRTLIRSFATSTDRRGALEVLATLVPFLLLWGIAAWSLQVSWWITAAATLGIAVILVRVFVLMHECGHGSLFGTQRYNRSVGFALGVLSGMPQYVWSQHHHHHHRTNGNWDEYRGPLCTLSVDEYASLSRFQQRVYRYTRHIALAPLAGFIYLILNPRVNWMKGSVALGWHVLRRKLAEPNVSMRAHAATFQTRLWKNAREYRHQPGNNLVLLSAWALMSWAMGPGAFFAIYLTSLSIAGAAGIVLFTVQHNFESAYASESADWDIDVGALDGTSFLVLPRWLHWATANIGYHHVHHLSAAIPCYHLPACHEEYRHLFTGVKRITLARVPHHLRFMLWDNDARRIVSLRDGARPSTGRSPRRGDPPCRNGF